MAKTSMSQYQKIFAKSKEAIDVQASPDHIIIQIGSATCENAAGAPKVYSEFQKHVVASKRDDIVLHRTGCTGRCSCEPIVNVLIPGKDPVKYAHVNRDLVHEIFISHILEGKPLTEHILDGTEKISPQKPDEKKQPVGSGFLNLYGDVPFFNRQTRLALRNSGVIDPENIDEYIQYGGFEALASVLDRNDPQWIVDEISKSKLRGRGGGGYPTGTKWSNAARQTGDIKYIICNADEGDPGAFMDRSMLEGDPYSIVEGMAIGAFAIGARLGFVYIRAEYPLAIKRIENAISRSREAGMLGENILGSGFDFDIEIRLGAGAFVCGEETALIKSIEGERGQPRIRPPYPSQRGLWGKPTVINNVETLANVALIIRYGADWFSQVGTEKSGGTKVFALAGKVEHTGLVEVPMGTTLRQIVYEVGGGILGGKKLKAIQTGGPAGGCIPAHLLDVPVDFDTLNEIGSMMGSGGMIVMSEEDCMVDIAKFFLEFTQSESCGKCTPCREGTRRMLEILERITAGKARRDDIEHLERLARLVQKASLCGLGRAAPNPVISTLHYFQEEYVAHVRDKHCPAKKCTALVHYEIDAKKCIGCTVCARNCPVSCIVGKAKKIHVIDQERCIKCGRCYQTCRFKAVELI